MIVCILPPHIRLNEIRDVTQLSRYSYSPAYADKRIIGFRVLTFLQILLFIYVSGDKMQQQPPQRQWQPLPPASQLSPNAITTEQIQKYLEDNKNLIMAILENQNLGKFQECAQYQAVLQKNLMYLAAIADAQPPTPQIPNPSQVMQMPPNSMPQQASNFMQQPPQQIPGGGSGVQKLPFQFNSLRTQDEQRQLFHFQQQQQLQSQMGLRAGAQNGLFGMQYVANPGANQGGSEVVLGGDGRSMLRSNDTFRYS